MLHQVLWKLRLPLLGKTLLQEVRRRVEKRVGFRVEDLRYERPGGVPGHAALAVVPLVDGDRALGAVLIVEDQTRAASLAEERVREELGVAARPRPRAPRSDGVAAPAAVRTRAAASRSGGRARRGRRQS